MGTAVDNSRINLLSIQPIKTLTPYQHTWTIKARVTNKGEIRTWNNARGSGKLLSVDLLDADGGEIRATLFNDAVEKYSRDLDVDKVYILSKGQVKLANKQYNKLRNDYELSLDMNSIIQACKEQQNDIPHQHYCFICIADINSREKDDIIDVCGIVIACGEKGSITVKNSDSPRQANKKNITILDESSSTIELTLWGKHAELEFNLDEAPVIAVKGCRVSTFNNRTLNTNTSSLIAVNPPIEKVTLLREWYDSQDRHLENMFPVTKSPNGPVSVNGEPVQRITDRKTFEQMRKDAVGKRDKGIYFETSCTVTAFKNQGKQKKGDSGSQQNSQPLWYHACPGEKCGRKVVQSSTGQWRCDNCAKDYPNFKLKYMLHFAATDFTGVQWLSCFDEVGACLLGKEASVMESLEQSDPAKFAEVFDNAVFKQYKFKIRAKEEVYNEEARLRCSVVSAVPINFAEESKWLIQQINSMK